MRYSILSYLCLIFLCLVVLYPHSALCTELPAPTTVTEEETKTFTSPSVIEKTESPSLSELKEGINSVSLLTLNNVIDYVVAHNPIIEEAHLEWQSKHRQANASWGDFEPSLNFNYGKSSLSRENTTLETLQQNFNPTYSELNKEYGAGIGGNFFSGTKYNVGYTGKHLQNSLTTRKEYQSFFGITGEQPLLKGLWYAAPIAGLKITRKEDTIAFNSYRKQLMEILIEAEVYYWNLAFAHEEYRMTNESVGIAEKLFKISQEQTELGKISELDLTEAKAELKNRYLQRAKAFQKLLDASTNLKLLLSDPEIKPQQILYTADSLLSESPQDIQESEESKEEGALAFETQPDITIKKQEVDREQIRLAYYKSQRLPELNLKGSYGWSGLDQTEEKSWEKIRNRTYPTWSVLLEMKIPFFAGIRERNELAAARLNKDIARQRLKATEYEVTRSLGALKQRIKSLENQIESAKIATECKKIILEVGISRFEEGKTDIRTVYESEEELFEVKKEELEGILRHKEALLQLKYLHGSSLLDKGLEQIKNNQLVLSEKIIDK